MSRYSICETSVKHPAPALLFLIEEEVHCGFEIVAVAETREDAIAIYDGLICQEVICHE